MEKHASVSEPSSELPVPSAFGDAAEEFPAKLEADFAPLVEAGIDNEPDTSYVDPHHAEST
jgi:hypothetical protein